MNKIDLFVSTWNDGKKLPESYVFPPEQRPGEDGLAPKTKLRVPMIDLGKATTNDRANVVRQIMEASVEFGAFQVKNHGVPIKLLDAARNVITEFFELPPEDKEKYISFDPKNKFTFCTSNLNYHSEKHHYWRDVVTQRCFPFEECSPFWPDKPANYREVIGEYTRKVNEVGLRILELIAEGLGLESDYFLKNKLTGVSEMNVNHYPSCPDPTKTWAVGKHVDRGLITLVLQGDISGLQFAKDDEWIPVDPIPDVFLINLANVMQIVSNGKLKSAEHQVVTNTKTARESLALFIRPQDDELIEPAKALVNEENPGIYRACTYREVLAAHFRGRTLKLSADSTVKTFLVQQ